MYIAGDTHGSIDVKKLNTKNFPDNQYLTEKDYLIIAGDFGFIWNNDKEDLYWLNWLGNKNFTTLFIDGNHENFQLLNRYPVVTWNGGKIHKISRKIFHLMRGQVFVIEGYKVFTFGGAKSTDIDARIENISWWREETPSQEELEEGLSNLKKYNFTVDYIITHTCSAGILMKIKELLDYQREVTEINVYFDMLEKKVSFKHWYFGHFHLDSLIDSKHSVLYNNIIKI